jgi:hypothetical protein
MKAAIRATAALAAMAAVTLVMVLPAAGHEAVGEPALTCDEVSVQLKDFPQSPSTITFHIDVNGTESTKTDQFTGPDGTASASIADLTTDTGTLNIEAFASWTIDGGDESDTAKLTTVCHENETPTTTGPPTLVGGVTADRPAGTPASATPAATAASSVTAAPRFTG